MVSMQLNERAAYDFTEFWVNGQIDGASAALLTKQLARLFPNATCSHRSDGHGRDVIYLGNF